MVTHPLSMFPSLYDSREFAFRTTRNANISFSWLQYRQLFYFDRNQQFLEFFKLCPGFLLFHVSPLVSITIF